MATITLDHVTKIEGHAGVSISIEEGSLKNLELQIFEGARFFESILKGKKYDELPLISARICGVCSPNHVLTSIRAIENAFAIRPAKGTKLLRELLAIGAMLQSHILHLYFLALPDYLGFESALQMQSVRRGDIERALKIKRLGNKIVTTVGGRDIHPLTAVPGGFSKTPTTEGLRMLMQDLKAAVEDAQAAFDLFSSLDYPEFDHQSTYMAVHEHSFLGTKISYLDKGTLQKITHGFEEHIKEYFQHDSTAEYVVAEGKSYTVGAQARLNTNWRLQDKELVQLINPGYPFHSPFSNIVCQSFELMSGIKRAVSICDEILNDQVAVAPPKEIKPKASTGVGVMEAPRGLLFHKYSFDENGYCTGAKVTTPTSQNLRTMERCLKAFVEKYLHLHKEELIRETEKLIRAFDPCISCSCH